MSAYLYGTAVLGADGLQNQYIVLRVRNIDKATLQHKLEEPPGEPPSPAWRSLKASLTGTSVNTLDWIPKAMLDLIVPFVVRMLRNDYGIDAQVTVSEVPPNMKVRERSEFFPGAVFGIVAGALLTSLAWGGKSLISNK